MITDKNMKIIVNNRYTYETGDIKVKKGDKVILATSSWLLDAVGPTWEGTVTALKSDYDGPCTKIIRVKKKA
jgi:hypothetical protein